MRGLERVILYHALLIPQIQAAGCRAVTVYLIILASSVINALNLAVVSAWASGV